MRVLLCFNDQGMMFQLFSRMKRLYHHFMVDYYFDMEHVICNHKVYDLVLMDVSIKDRSCFELVPYLYERNHQCLIVLMSHDLSYYQKAIENHIYRYIPININHHYFDQMIQNIYKKYRYHKVMCHIKIHKKEIMLYPRDIIYIETKYEKIFFNTIYGFFEVEVESLNELKILLSDYHFIQVHQSFFINLEYVCCVKKGYLVLSTNQQIPYSLSNQKWIKQEIEKYLLFQH